MVISSLSAHRGNSLLWLPKTAIRSCLIFFLFWEALKVWEKRSILIPCISNIYDCFFEALNWRNQFLKNEDKDFSFELIQMKMQWSLSALHMCLSWFLSVHAWAVSDNTDLSNQLSQSIDSPVRRWIDFLVSLEHHLSM